jgi:hypothetical protein
MAVVVVVRDIVVYTLDVANGPNPVNRIFVKTPPSEFS